MIQLSFKKDPCLVTGVENGPEAPELRPYFSAGLFFVLLELEGAGSRAGREHTSPHFSTLLHTSTTLQQHFNNTSTNTSTTLQQHCISWMHFLYAFPGCISWMHFLDAFSGSISWMHFRDAFPGCISWMHFVMARGMHFRDAFPGCIL